MNIGWIVAKYDNEHRTCVTAEDNSMAERFIRGPKSSFYEIRKCEEDFKISNNPTTHFILALIWPLFIIVPIIGWWIFGISLLVESIMAIVVYALWFIFGGGIAKVLNLL